MHHSLKWTFLAAIVVFLIGTFLLGWLADHVGAEQVRLSLMLANIIVEKILNVETGEPVANDVPIRALEFTLSHWTNLALTIGARATDEDMAFEMAGALLINHVDRYEAYIIHWRTTHPRAYEHLLDLRNRWKDRLRAEKEAGVRRRFLPSDLPAWKP